MTSNRKTNDFELLIWFVTSPKHWRVERTTRLTNGIKTLIFVFSFQDGLSALMLALHNGHTETAKYLIEAKASVDLQTQVYYVKIK